MKTNLQKTIFNLAMNGGSVMDKETNEIFKVCGFNRDTNECLVYKDGVEEYSIDLLKPLLHSFNKLTEPDNDYFYELNQQLCEVLNMSSCHYFIESLLKNQYYALSYNISIEANKFLKENHFNTENLQPNEFIEITSLKK